MNSSTDPVFRTGAAALIVLAAFALEGCRILFDAPSIDSHQKGIGGGEYRCDTECTSTETSTSGVAPIALALRVQASLAETPQLVVRSVVDSALYIDGKEAVALKAGSPVVISVLPGAHDLRVVVDGSPPVSASIVINRGEYIELSIQYR